MNYIIIPKSTIFICTWTFAVWMLINFLESAVTNNPFIASLYVGCALFWAWLPFNISKKGKIDKIIRTEAPPDE